jgi:hypothetical protein
VDALLISLVAGLLYGTARQLIIRHNQKGESNEQ